MHKFVERPSIRMYEGIIVDKNTRIEFSNDNVTQTISDLMLHTVQTVSGEGYTSTQDTVIYLSEGDVLIFEEAGRGYIKPVNGFCSVEEAIKDLEVLKGGD